MKTSTRSALREQLANLQDTIANFAADMDSVMGDGLVTDLQAGSVVQFKSRGRMLTGTIGQVSDDSEKLYVYVENEDGFGTTGFRVLRSAVIEPEVESGLTDEDVQYLVKLLKVKMEA